VRVDTLAVRLRPRTPLEATDLGVNLCQRTVRSVYACSAVAALPVMAIAAGSYELAHWLPTVVIWCAKPWLDRTILFVLARAAFGQPTDLAALWKSQRDVWWRQLLFTLLVRRVSLWRSLTQPVYQLEGGSIRESGARVRQIRRGQVMSGSMASGAFATTELALTLSLLSLVFWFAPSGILPDVDNLLSGTLPQVLSIALPISYAIAVFFVEPFYVAAGFAMYLNRRADLEAWDIEQEFRRAFSR
jgi:hypothetical protein